MSAPTVAELAAVQRAAVAVVQRADAARRGAFPRVYRTTERHGQFYVWRRVSPVAVFDWYRLTGPVGSPCWWLVRADVADALGWVVDSNPARWSAATWAGWERERVEF